MIDALSRRTEYAYDSMGNVSSVTRMAGTSEAVTTSFTNEISFNQVASVTDPLNHTTSFAHDAPGNLISVTDALNNQTMVAYNSAGQPTSVTDPIGNTTQFGYAAGDLVSVTDPLGQTASRFIDAVGRVVSMTNPLRQTIRYEYDSLNRPTRVTDPLQGLTQFPYDPNGNLLGLTDARNNVTSYVYDNMDRVQTRTDPLLHAETYQYNENGSLTQHTDRKGQVTNYTYDSLERLSQVTFADSSTVTNIYDSVSRLTQVTDSISGTITYAYDNLDRLLSEATPQGAIGYTYDAADRRATMSVPGQSVVTYSYDNANRLIQVAQGMMTVQFAYDAESRRTALTLPNGVVTEYTYDATSQLVGLIYRKGTTTLGNLTYEYDSAGRRAKSGGSFGRINLSGTMMSASYNEANQQNTFGSQPLTFDLNGNLTSDGLNSYAWDVRDQLMAMSGAGLTASFQYDADGRRVSKTVNGATTTFLYDGANIAQEQVAGTPSANQLVGGIDEVFARVESSGTSSPVADNLGSAVALTDSAGALQTQYTYEPFGKTTTSGPTSGNAQKYTSREDDGTSLYYYRARYYSPTLQRFISEDPIEFDGGPNLYEYVFNNPVNGIDPWGLQKSDPGFWSLYGSYTVGVGKGVVGAVKAPFDMAMHPVQTVKGIGEHVSSLCSIVAHPVQAYDATIDAIIELGPNHAMETLGDAGGQVVGAYATGKIVRFARYGRERGIGANCRIAPFGNRTGHPTGRWPHYHRRVPDPNRPGHGMPDQGIGRHRPWDSSPRDKSWRDRF